MEVITSGARYIDVDAYACVVSLAELRHLQGHEAAAVSTARWNESITPSLRALQAPLMTTYEPHPDDQFVVADLSDPSQFDSIVDPARVVEVIDHHPGFEDYWKERLEDASHIEFIGAAATLVYEQWQEAGKLDEMSRTSALLLAAAIQDNTLHFGASVTTDRDTAAYRFLAKHADITEAWVAQYFSECQQAVLADLPTALANDTKFLRFSGLPSELALGQLALWDAQPVIETRLPAIADTLRKMRPLWLANIINISGGQSYFLTDHPEVQVWLRDLLGVRFQGSTAIADKLWLRKEIMKRG